ncbi:MAG TPA: serine kinase [Oscillatoriales cyanobacterium M59_W2019_021]|nr:serine kinase [Oscillatoriales cyanobacterium M4454_W2019_049]HIK51260.1 serine kinase [Oscillatoriales cyanobacterium M59_W2019_021]
MYNYKAYNLSIKSDFYFPELLDIENSASSDIEIRISFLSISNSEIDNHPTSFLGKVDGAGLFLIRNGNEIIVDPEPGVEEALIRPLLLGPIMCILLRQRGMLVLHGSSVVIGDEAIAFIGHSGWGKSTLADSFHAKGYPLLTDDVMALRMDRTQPIVFPSFPQVKLWPDAAKSIGHDPSQLPFLNSQSEKLAHKLTNGFVRDALPLKRLYVLGVGTHHEIISLQPQQAFVELVRHSRTITLLNDSLFLGNHLQHCTKLIEQVPIALLNRCKSLAAIPELIELIENDIATLNSQIWENQRNDSYSLCSA